MEYHRSLFGCQMISDELARRRAVGPGSLARHVGPRRRRSSAAGGVIPVLTVIFTGFTFVDGWPPRTDPTSPFPARHAGILSALANRLLSSSQECSSWSGHV